MILGRNMVPGITVWPPIGLIWTKSGQIPQNLAPWLVSCLRVGYFDFVKNILKVASGRHSQQIGNKYSTTNCRFVASLLQHRLECLVAQTEVECIFRALQGPLNLHFYTVSKSGQLQCVLLMFQCCTEYSKQSTFSVALQVPWNYTEPALHFDGKVEIPSTLTTPATCCGSWDKFNSGNIWFSCGHLDIEDAPDPLAQSWPILDLY